MAQWNSLLLVAFAALLLPGTAHAQIFWKSPEFAAPPMAALDPVFDGNFTGITRAETDAIILWNLRSALNLAALQCGFEPLLRTVPNYNGMLFNHKDELSSAYLQIQGYFKRTKKAAAQSAMDQFATRLISRYSTVFGQLGFCELAGKVGHESKFVSRGGLTAFAMAQVPRLRKSLALAGDQQFHRTVLPVPITRLPRPDPACWHKKKGYNVACGYI